MKFVVVSLFPEMFTALTQYGVSGRAFKQDKAQLEVINPRQFSEDKHQTVDDRPYGGGPGMLMKAEPLAKAIGLAKTKARSQGAQGEPKPKSKPAKVIYLSPQGKPLEQADVVRFSQYESMILLCGRYEGIDERLIESEVDEQYSLGDFVLSGGELAAMALIDATLRLLPDVLGHEDSAVEDSFMQGLLDCPHYTRPEVFNGMSVPSVLLSGDHKRIKQWRAMQALGRTRVLRPDLLEKLELNQEQIKLLNEYQHQQAKPEREQGANDE